MKPPLFASLLFFGLPLVSALACETTDESFQAASSAQTPALVQSRSAPPQKKNSPSTPAAPKAAPAARAQPAQPKFLFM